MLNSFEANKKRKRVELKIEQKWEIIEYRNNMLNLARFK